MWKIQAISQPPSQPCVQGDHRRFGRTATREKGLRRQWVKKTAPTNGAPKTVGPVADLERHLPSDWWRTLFNSIYLKTDGDVVENNKNTSQEIDMLVKHAGLQLNDRILDLCCGQGRHSLELARRGFKNVTGVDRSRYLIRLAKKRAKKEGVPVNFHEGDARKFRLPENSFHCVSLMGNSFGYFDREEDDVQVLEAVKRVLVPSGLIVMDLADGEWIKAHFDKRSWEWIDEDPLRLSRAVPLGGWTPADQPRSGRSCRKGRDRRPVLR